MARSTSEKGGGDFSPAAIFLKNERRTHGTRMKDDGGRENDAFYGFIMRMVDQKGDPREEAVTHGCPVCLPLFPDHTHTCVYVKGMTALRLSTTKLGNEPSRRPDLLPNKIYIRIHRGGTPFFISTPPYIILEATSSSSSSTHHHSCFSVITQPQSVKSLIYRRSLTFRGIIHRGCVSACLRKRLQSIIY